MEFGQYGDYLVQIDIKTGTEKYHVNLAIQMLNDNAEELPGRKKNTC